MAKNDLTAQRLRELVHYDPETGVFTRRVSTANSAQIGQRAGCHNSDGYLQFCVDGRNRRSARLAWLYMTGQWPDQIDHINGIRDDDRFSNLRNVSPRVNQLNRGNPAGNFSTKFSGVDRHGPGWRAVIEVNGKRARGKSRSTKSEAEEDYLRMKIDHFRAQTPSL